MRRAVLVAGLLLLATWVPAQPAPAQGTGGRDEPTGQLVLASQTPWVRPDGELVLRVRPVTAADPGDVTLGVTLHARVSSRSQFARTVEGRLLGRVLRRGRATPLSDLLPVTEALAVTVRLRPGELGATSPGVYPLVVALGHGSRVLDRIVTHLVVVPAEVAGPKLGLAWVARLHASPALQPDGTRRLPGAERLTQLAEILAAHPGVPLSLAVTPETAEALAATGPTGRAALSSLRATLGTRTILARPYVPVDVAQLAAAGLDRHFGIQLQRGTDVLTRLLGAPPDRFLWLVDAPLDDDALAELRGRQVDRLVLPEDGLAPVSLPVTLAQPFLVEPQQGPRYEAAMADAGLAAHFAVDDPVLGAHRVLADLAVLWSDSPARERAVVAVTPRSWRPTRPFLDALLGGLSTSPLVEPMTLGTLFSRIEPATSGRGRPLVRRLAEARAPSLGVRASRLVAARSRLDALGSILPPSSPTYGRLERLLLVAEAAGLRGSARADYLDGLERAVAAEAARIEVAHSRTVTITAREAQIPLAIRNRSREVLEVRVRIESEKLEFPGGFAGGAEKTVRLLPSNTTVTFPVRARTSGAFPLRVSLLAPEGDLLLADTRWTVRSTAFSGLGLVLSAGAGAFLLVWWARHLARGRRARRLVPA